MPAPSPQPAFDAAQRIANLEARLARLEAYVGLDELQASSNPTPARPASSEEIEREMGENWFARVGILACAIGAGYMLTLPYPGVPGAVPSIAGVAAGAVLFVLAHAGRRSFALISSYLRGAAMALVYCAVLRLFFFGQPPPLRATPAGAGLLIVAAAVLNLSIAWRRRSPGLMALALATAALTPLVLDRTALLLPAVVALAGFTVVATMRVAFAPLLPVGMALAFASYGLWAAGNVVVGHAYHWTADPAGAALWLLLACVVAGLGPLAWPPATDTPAATSGAAVNCALGYGLFLVHTYATATVDFAALQMIAALVFLWMAAVFWMRLRSQAATFLYAMTGYGALTAAIVHVAAVPDVFVWLSAESLVVVATAVWFRSQFIVVTNFVIYVAVVLAYVLLNTHESGASLGFGVAALASARILNWQRHRLDLRTDAMRNAYLLSAFVVFPYALFHLVPARFVALAWVALAVLYYALNIVIRNQKYRWMAHATLLLTAVYLAVPGHAGLTPAYRIASFLALGATFLVVSLVFTRAQQRQRAGVHPATPPAAVDSDRAGLTGA